MILSLCDYPCEKEVSDNVYSGKVQDSANGNTQNNAGSSLIHCEALGRPAWNSEEQRWQPALVTGLNNGYTTYASYTSYTTNQSCTF